MTRRNRPAASAPRSGRDRPGRITRLNVPAMIALFTGMRLGEILALRWNRVDLAQKVAKVREALEQTKAHGIKFKPPKSKAGRSRHYASRYSG